MNFEYFLNERSFFVCYRQGSGKHEIACILLEIVLTVALNLSTEKAQKSMCVKRKRLNGSRMFIFYTNVIKKSWILSISC